MSAHASHDDPLEAWKTAYNETGSGSVELPRSPSRGCRVGLRATGSGRWTPTLRFSASPGDIGVLFRAIELAGACPTPPRSTLLNWDYRSLPLRWTGTLSARAGAARSRSDLRVLHSDAAWSGAVEPLHDGAAALAEAGELHPELRAAAEHELTTLVLDFYHRGGSTELSVDIDACRALVRLSPSADHLNDLAATLDARHERGEGEPGDLDEMIDVFERLAAVGRIPRKRYRAQRPRCRSSPTLPAGARARGHRHGDIFIWPMRWRWQAAISGVSSWSLSAMISVIERRGAGRRATMTQRSRSGARNSPPHRSTHRTTSRTGWAASSEQLIERYECFGDAAHLDTAVDAVDSVRAATAGLPLSSAYRQRLADLAAGAIERRLRASGGGGDLDQLIAMSRRELGARRLRSGGHRRARRAITRSWCCRNLIVVPTARPRRRDRNPRGPSANRRRPRRNPSPLARTYRPWLPCARSVVGDQDR